MTLPNERARKEKGVAAGSGETVSLTLFVLGAGRHAITDLVDFEVEAEQLSFDFDTAGNNYAEVAAEIFGKADGRVHITGYSQRLPFVMERPSQFGYPVFFQATPRVSVSELEDLYFLTAASDSGTIFDERMQRCVDLTRPYDAETRIVGRCGEAPCPSDFDWRVISPRVPDISLGGEGGQGGAAGGVNASKTQASATNRFMKFGSRRDNVEKAGCRATLSA